MAIKLCKGIKTVGASIIDGNLSITLLDKTWNITVPIQQNFNFQVNEHNNEDVFCFVKNENYVLVIRRNGTGSIMWKETHVLIKNFVVQIPQELISGLLGYGGFCVLSKSSEGCLATCYILDKSRIGIYSINDHSYSIVFDIDNAQEFVTDLSLQHGPSYPMLTFDGESLCSNETPGDAKTPVMYSFKGKVIEHQAPMVLI